MTGFAQNKNASCKHIAADEFEVDVLLHLKGRLILGIMFGAK